MKLLLYSLLWALLFPSIAMAQGYQKYLSYTNTDLDSLREVLYKQGAYQEQVFVTQAFRQKVKLAKGVEDSLFAQLALNLSAIHNQLGAYETALAFSEEAVAIFEKTFGKKHLSFAEATSYVAGIYMELGDYPSALALFQQALDIAQRGAPQNPRILGYIFINFADLQYRRGNYQAALSMIYKGLDLEEKFYGRTHYEFASSLNITAQIHRELGDYEKAIGFYLEAKNIKEKFFGKEHPEYTSILNNLAVVYYELGLLQQALDTYLEIKEIDERQGNQYSLEFSALLNNLAVIHQDLGKYEQSLAFYLQAKEIDEGILGKEHPDLAISLNNLAYLYQDMGVYDKALYYYLETQKIDQKTLGPNHPDVAAFLCNLSYLYAGMGNDKKVRSTLRKVLAISSSFDHSLTIDQAWKDSLLQISYPSNLHLNITIGALEALYYLLPRTSTLSQKQQLILSELIVTLYSRLKNTLYDDKDKLRVLRSSHQWLRTQLSLLEAPQDAAKAFAISDWNKSVLLLEAIQSETDYRLGDLPDSLAEQDQVLHQERADLQAQLLEKRPSIEKKQLQTQLVKVDHRIERFENLVKKDYPKYYQLKYQEPTTSVQGVQANLDAETALLEYVIGDSVIHIFYIDQQEVVWRQSFISNKLLQQRIKSFRKSVSNYELLVRNQEKAYHTYIKFAHWFFEQLVAPVLEGQEGIKNLIIVTDGKLGHLPFETFLVEEAPQGLTPFNQLPYLLNEFNISYNSSAALWRENSHALTNNNNGQILGVAASYSSSSDSSLIAARLPMDQRLRKALIPLPNARQEVESLAADFEGFFAFDEQACERIIKAKAADFAVLHFATHGILNQEKPVLSSLVLTEDGDSSESNFWQAYEISKLDLNAELVVLSACETGFGTFEQGNGIASLARSFMYAGAPSLVVSLWQVNDYATSIIMKKFYHNLSLGMKKDAALRQAKIDFMTSTEGNLGHPALWSPFIQIGNTAPVLLIKKRSSLSWWIGFSLLIVALGMGGLVYKKRAS
ncbi:MAG: CHAT domain-containing protein [Aureispira sp.]